MALKKETAEQKLLKMIEASGGKSPALVQNKSSTKQSVIGFIKAANKVLVIVVCVAFVFVVNEVFKGKQLLSKSDNIAAERSSSKVSSGNKPSMPVVPNVEYYLGMTKKRNIFLPYEPSAVKNVVEVSSGNTRIAQMTQNLRLVGVSWFDTVESASVMIEDVDKKETYFLMRGDKIGDVNIKTIYADSVKLGYDNEEIIIRYDKSNM
jgi:hypothetical protein